MPEAQRNDLADLYREMADAELLNLARTREELTEPAQQALAAELSRRGMDSAAVASAADMTRPEPDLNAHSSLTAYTDLAREGNAIEFVEVRDALEASESLTVAGIDHVVLIPRLQVLDVWAPRLVFDPRDDAAARKVLDQYSAQAPDLSGEKGEQPEGDASSPFEAPACPRCGTADPVLESANPANIWHCESCGNTWRDSIPG